MMISLDVTNQFYLVDCYQATLGFSATRQLPSKIQFPVWGARLAPFQKWPANTLNLPASIDPAKWICFKNEVMLEFQRVCGGEIGVSLFDPRGSIADFHKNKQGEILELKRSWPNSANDCRKYMFMCVLDWPYGECMLNLFATGPVLFYYDQEELFLQP